MRDRVQAYRSTHDVPASKIALVCIVYIVALYTIFVGSNPFSERSLSTYTGTSGVSYFYLTLYVSASGCFFLYLFKNFSSGITNVGIPLALIMGWSLLSLFWSEYTLVALIRWGQLLVVTVVALVAFRMLGASKSQDLLLRFLFVVVVVDWISLFFVPQAVHLSGELDVNIIGAWRGLHSHKNVAAPIMCISAILFFSEFLRRRSIYTISGLILSLGFLVGTNSRTSIFLLLFVFVIFIGLKIFVRSRASSGFVLWFGVVSLASGAIFVLAMHDYLREAMSNPALLSGRGELWRVIFAASERNFFLGAGYGSFWRFGDDGPSYFYTTGWHAASFNGHNGYLDIMLTLGIVGLILALLVYVVHPFLLFFSRPSNMLSRKTEAAVLSFVALHNLLESTFLMWNADSYFVWLLMYFSLRSKVNETESVQ